LVNARWFFRLIGRQAGIVDGDYVAISGDSRGGQAERKRGHLAPRILHAALLQTLVGQLRPLEHDFRIGQPRSAAVVTDTHLDFRRTAAVHIDHCQRPVGKGNGRRGLSGHARIPNRRPGATVIERFTGVDVSIDGLLAIDGPEEIEDAPV
jgi:hypothetical protein